MMVMEKAIVLCLLSAFGFTAAEKSNVYEKGSSVTLNCSSSEPIQWLKNNESIGSQKIYTLKENSLTFVIDKATIGTYTCLAGELVVETYEVLTSPIPDPENKLEKNAIFGETFVYDCKGYGNPQPVVMWLKNDEALNMSNSRITLKDSNDLVNGSLRINNVEYDDSGEYTCRASNANGNFTVKVKVNVKDQYAALWPFFGICLEVVILCAIIFIYEKRRSKRAQEEQQKEDADQLTSNNDRATEELRQRKV